MKRGTCEMSQKRYCLITGASRGLGKAIAKYFWQQGWSLILLARDHHALNEVVRTLGEREGQSVSTLGADLSRPEEIERIVEAAKSLTPRLDALINNAGIQGAVGPVWENNWQQWLETLQVDLLAPVGLCRLTAPWMAANGGGSIISISGGGATGPRANFSAYATAKAGLVRFSETLAEELKLNNVRVNCVAPGAMGTSMLEEVVAKGEAVAGKKEYELAFRVLHEGGTSLQRVAELCFFLATNSSQGITGKLISTLWDNWEQWPEHLSELNASDAYTLRRIVGRDRGFEWGDK